MEYTLPKAAMTVKDVSAYLQMHPITIYRLVHDKKLPCFRVGNRLRFRQDHIDQMLSVGMSVDRRKKKEKK